MLAGASARPRRCAACSCRGLGGASCQMVPRRGGSARVPTLREGHRRLRRLPGRSHGSQRPHPPPPVARTFAPPITRLPSRGPPRGQTLSRSRTSSISRSASQRCGTPTRGGGSLPLAARLEDQSSRPPVPRGRGLAPLWCAGATLEEPNRPLADEQAQRGVAQRHHGPTRPAPAPTPLAGRRTPRPGVSLRVRSRRGACGRTTRRMSCRGSRQRLSARGCRSTCAPLNGR